jgi:hypothetical protein
MDEQPQDPQTLWTIHREDHVMTCTSVSAPAREELRVFVDGNLYLNELYPHHDSLLGRAHMLHRNLLKRGWADGEQPTSGI